MYLNCPTKLLSAADAEGDDDRPLLVPSGASAAGGLAVGAGAGAGGGGGGMSVPKIDIGRSTLSVS